MTADELDRFAADYYLADVDDIGIEERQQVASLPMILDGIGGRVLEMGYGTGIITGALLNRGVNVEVVEGSAVLTAEATAVHPGLTAHLSLFEDFSPAEPYDAVLCLHVLEHVADPLALLQRIHSWLRPGGVLVTVVPNAESLHRNLAVRMGLQPTLDTLSDRDRLVGHRRVYTIGSLTRVLRDAGFDAKEPFGYFLKVVPNSMMLDWSVDLLDALNAISPTIPPRLLANIGVRAVPLAAE